jgi:hypothetical protein
MLASEVLADISGISLSPQMSKSIFNLNQANFLYHLFCVSPCFSSFFFPLSLPLPSLTHNPSTLSCRRNVSTFDASSRALSQFLPRACCARDAACGHRRTDSRRGSASVSKIDQADMFTGRADSEIVQDEEEVVAIHCETTEGEDEATGGEDER